MPVLSVDGKAAGDVTAAAHANCSCGTAAFGVIWLISDGGSTFDRRAIEPVTSSDGRLAATCSRSDFDVQPDMITQIEAAIKTS